MDNLLVETNPNSLYNRFCNMLKKPTGVGAAMRGTEKDYPDCGVKDTIEMRLANSAST